MLIFFFQLGVLDSEALPFGKSPEMESRVPTSALPHHGGLFLGFPALGQHQPRGPPRSQETLDSRVTAIAVSHTMASRACAMAPGARNHCSSILPVTDGYTQAQNQPSKSASCHPREERVILLLYPGETL